MRKSTFKSYLMFITAMLVFGTIGIFRRYIPLSSALLSFSRGVLGSAVLLCYMALRRRKLQRLSHKHLIMLIVSGILMGLNWIFLFESYNYTTVATATMCYYMQPTILILLSPIVFHERLTPKKLLCAAAAVVGMLFVSGVIEGGGIGAGDTRGILCGLAAAALYASVVIFNKLVPLDDPFEKTAIQLISAAVVLIPYLLLTEDISQIHLDTSAVIMTLVVGIFHTGISYAMYFASMRDLKAQSIAVLGYIDPVFALLLSAAVLHEKLTLLGIIGAVLIIGSALVSELEPAKTPREDKHNEASRAL